MNFRYKAKDNWQKTSTGFIEADDARQAARLLQERGFAVLSLAPAGRPAGSLRLPLLGLLFLGICMIGFPKRSSPVAHVPTEATTPEAVQQLTLKGTIPHAPGVQLHLSCSALVMEKDQDLKALGAAGSPFEWKVEVPEKAASWTLLASKGEQRWEVLTFASSQVPSRLPSLEPPSAPPPPSTAERDQRYDIERRRRETTGFELSKDVQREKVHAKTKR